MDSRLPRWHRPHPVIKYQHTECLTCGDIMHDCVLAECRKCGSRGVIHATDHDLEMMQRRQRDMDTKPKRIYS